MQKIDQIRNSPSVSFDFTMLLHRAAVMHKNDFEVFYYGTYSTCTRLFDMRVFSHSMMKFMHTQSHSSKWQIWKIDLFERNSSFSVMACSNYWEMTQQFVLLNGLYVNICTFQISAVSSESTSGKKF